MTIYVSLTLSAAITSQTDVKKSKTDASKHKQKSQARPSSETLHAFTTAPGPTVSAPPATPTPHPRATGVEGRADPIVVPAKKDKFIISEYTTSCTPHSDSEFSMLVHDSDINRWRAQIQSSYMLLKKLGDFCQPNFLRIILLTMTITTCNEQMN